ncbi:hypothetical protein [Plantibacter sp. M259]|uniref:hypothetical protein n=1 Tax=Plantibacter sp. M259 TaxID=2583822 RepID=UPI001110BAEF|nr:hypothetical protein [Plantibacter sp. M259]
MMIGSVIVLVAGLGLMVFARLFERYAGPHLRRTIRRQTTSPDGDTVLWRWLGFLAAVLATFMLIRSLG